MLHGAPDLRNEPTFNIGSHTRVIRSVAQARLYEWARFPERFLAGVGPVYTERRCNSACSVRPIGDYLVQRNPDARATAAHAFSFNNGAEPEELRQIRLEAVAIHQRTRHLGKWPELEDHK